MDPQSHPRKSQLRTVLTMIANPGEVIKKQLIKIPWPYTILLSGLAFTLFFLQTGIDLFRAGTIGIERVILIAMIGLFFGTAGVVLLAMLSYLLAQGGKRNLPPGWAISNFALGYSVTLIYSLCGLLFSLAFHWNTAVAFGITGVLWSLRPTLFTIKQMSGDATVLSVVLTTLCGAIMLFGWGLLGQLGF
ncbi:hypothetical protein [Acetobacterium sp.]|uniref:hypothetical protein n=1 Tax=Acetobacterium sp. TaxID=1872094 RepID=UPI00359328EF